MIQKFFILLFCLGGYTAFCQKITGVIQSEDGGFLIGCTVSISTIETKKIIKLNVTNNSGTYFFDKIPTGNLQLNASYIGYENFSTKILIKENETLTLPIIVLKKNKNNLAEVVVKSVKPMVEVKADRMIVNVEGTINAIGTDALELIRKSPGISVDKDDAIQMSGKAGAQIYIDGKASPLSGEDLSNYLKSLQSSQIEALEIITNPSAKYEAAGNAGIINIRLKKNKTFGSNGTVGIGYSVGVYSKYNAAFGLNHRTKKLNLFGSYNFNEALNVLDFRLNRRIADTLFDLKSIRKFENVIHGFKFGADFFINKKSTFGILINGNYTNAKPTAYSTTPIIALASNTVTKILVSDNVQTGNNNNLNYNANYKHAAANNTSLNIDADYGVFRISRDLYQPNIYYNATNTAIISEANFNLISKADISIYSFKMDYEKPIAKGILGIGLKTSYVTSYNNFKRFNVLSPQLKTFDSTKSNQFDYKENINALYINYNRNWKYIQLQAGLRAEQTTSEGSSYPLFSNTTINYAGDNPFKRNYINLFPSLGIGFIKNPNSLWNINIGRRVDRPNYQDLNPFEYKIDEYTYRRGNTELVPQFSYNIAITNTFYKKLISKLSYSKITNQISQIVDTIDKSKNFIYPKNIASQQLVAFFASYQYQQKWYTSFITGNAFYTNFKANFGAGNRTINRSAFALIATWQNSFKLPRNWVVEGNANYSSPTVNGIFYEKVKWGIDAGAQKIILKGLGNIKFSVTDIFWTNFDRNVGIFAGQNVDGYIKRESRLFKINFSYRFGNNQVKASRNRSSGSEDEIKRSQTGGG